MALGCASVILREGWRNGKREREEKEAQEIVGKILNFLCCTDQSRHPIDREAPKRDRSCVDWYGSSQMEMGWVLKVLCVMAMSLACLSFISLSLFHLDTSYKEDDSLRRHLQGATHHLAALTIPAHTYTPLVQAKPVSAVRRILNFNGAPGLGCEATRLQDPVEVLHHCRP